MLRFTIPKVSEAVRSRKRARWSGRGDLNSRPPAPKAGALPGCATPRHEDAVDSTVFCHCSSSERSHDGARIVHEFYEKVRESSDRARWPVRKSLNTKRAC
jgi:hypothetical protein